jgi:hypothetical protein
MWAIVLVVALYSERRGTPDRRFIWKHDDTWIAHPVMTCSTTCTFLGRMGN